MPIDHQRQRAVYLKAKNNYDVEFAYVSAKGAKILADGDASEHLVTMKNAALRFEKFLALGDAKHLQRSCLLIRSTETLHHLRAGKR